MVRSFRKIDTDNDGYISEEEFIGHVLRSNHLAQGNIDLDRFGPTVQVEELLRQIKRSKSAYESLASENEQLRKNSGLGSSKTEQENQRLLTENTRLSKEVNTLREDLNVPILSFFYRKSPLCIIL